MADNVAITAGSGTTVATDNIGGVNYQRIKVTWGAHGTATDVDVAASSPMPVQLRGSDGTDRSNALPVSQSGTWTVQPGNTANTTAWKVDNTAALDKGSGTGGSVTQRVIVDSSQLATLGQAAMAASQPVVVASNQSGLANRGFVVAFATLTRPANQTPYTAADSISDNATAGSVTALVSGNISDTNDDPIFISDILVSSTDTGLAGKRIRAYLFNSDPTASSGVGAGDNVTYSQKKAGYIGSFSGTLETGFSDGTVGRLVPSFNDSATAPTPNVGAGGFVLVKPVSGAKTLYIQYQTLDGFTSSANSTTIIGTARGWQGRAA